MQSKEVIRVENLSKKFRRFHLRDVNFSLKEGYIMGVIGKNGAGKTTLMRLLLGVYTANSGEITVNGEKFYKNNCKLRQKIGYIAEDNQFLMSSTLLDNGTILGKFYDDFDLSYYKSLLARFQLDLDKTPNQLSKGMKTKFQLAFTLANHPKILLLDETTAGLDPLFRQEFLQILQSLVDEQGMAILLSSHITTDLDKVADYVMILDEGKVLSLTTKEDLMDEYRLVKGPRELLHQLPNDLLLSVKATNSGFEGLAYRTGKIRGEEEWLRKLVVELPDLSDILYYLTKKNISMREERDDASKTNTI
ncbi:ABC transporter ATP-binding protein [Anaerosporobacter faecicola]|uniref:ABC transporter ATP-binding protein n=1 Tax=Anaerosporobacter faecicola TaxID=2718714 RepID=UPI002368AEA6|nr:ABC transporter ATP-binding protein [Anaerosporobacter faecicola]